MNAALSQWEKVGISPDMIISRMSLHMEKTFRSVTPAMMDQAVDMILKAEHIYLFAPDASGQSPARLIFVQSCTLWTR